MLERIQNLDEDIAHFHQYILLTHMFQQYPYGHFLFMMKTILFTGEHTILLFYTYSSNTTSSSEKEALFKIRLREE